MRDSSSVRLIWSVSPTPDSGGLGSGPRGDLPSALAASRLARLASYSACSAACLSAARASIFALRRLSPSTDPPAAPVLPVCPCLPARPRRRLPPLPSVEPPPPLIRGFRTEPGKNDLHYCQRTTASGDCRAPDHCLKSRRLLRPPSWHKWN